MTPIARFYPIVDSARWVARLLPVGARLIQLRLKDRSEAEVRDEVRSAKAICANFGAQLVVNDYWTIAIEESCDFVHLGQEDLAAADLMAIRRTGMRIGISTHDHAELETALGADPDYVALDAHSRDLVWKLSSLLRIADALDRGHYGNITSLKTICRQESCSIHVTAQADPQLELWAARLKSDMFQQTFDRPCKFAAKPVNGRG